MTNKLRIGDTVHRPTFKALEAMPKTDGTSILGRRVIKDIPIGEVCPACGKRHHKAQKVYYYEDGPEMIDEQIPVTAANIDALCKELGMERAE